MADKTSPVPHMPSDSARKQMEISEDITRIVGYLSEKRSSSNERASGLIQEITQRRGEVPESEGLNRQSALSSDLTEMVEALPERDETTKSIKANPALAERYHAFCHDLDTLLDTFRARVEGNKPVQH